jgi:hypothetical protein
MSGTAQSQILWKHSLERDAGGRGRIRTSVARKERQIYSLLVLATHPPVPRDLPGHSYCHRIPTGNIAMQKGLVSGDTSPSSFIARNSSASRKNIPARKIQLAEGIEPPTL